MARIRLLSLLVSAAALAGTAGCRDFTVPPRDTDRPRVDSIGPEQLPDGGLAGFWRDRVVIEGEHLDKSVTVRVGGEVARVVESGSTRLVVEIPDLGKVSGSTLVVTAPDLEPVERALRFDGPGQPRTLQPGVAEPLSPALKDFGTLTVLGAQACHVDAGAPAGCSVVAEIERGATEVVLATGSSDYLVPLSLDLNLAETAIDAPAPLVASTGLVIPQAQPVGDFVVFPTVVIALDETGQFQLGKGGLFKLAPDSGWMMFGSRFEPAPETKPMTPPAWAQMAFALPATPSLTVLGQFAALVADVYGAWGVGGAIVEVDATGAPVTTLATASLVARRGSPQLLSTPAGMVLAGAVASPATTAGSVLSTVRVATVDEKEVIELTRLPFRLGSGDPIRLEDALMVPADEEEHLVVLGAAFSADGRWLAVSMLEPVTGLPQLYSFHLESDAFVPQHSSSSANALVALTYAAAGDPPALFGVEALSGQVVKVDPVRLLPEAGYAIPGVTSGYQLAGFAPSSDRRFLVVADESGAVHRFNTQTASFLPPIVSDRNLGAVHVLSGPAGTARAVVNEGFSGLRGAAGEVTLSWRGYLHTVLGGGNRATALLPLEPDLAAQELFRYAVVGPGLPGDACDGALDCPAGAACVTNQCRKPGELRTTAISSSLRASSDRCELSAVPRAVVPTPSGGLVAATSPAWSETPPRVDLFRFSKPNPSCAELEAAFGVGPAASVTPNQTGWTCDEDGQCERPVSLVALPDGREALSLPLSGGAFVVNESKVEALAAPDLGDPELVLHAVALSADARACKRGFVPALFTAWADYSGWNGAITALPLADGACTQRSLSEAAQVKLESPDLAGLAGLEVAPNGRQLLAVLDLFMSRRVAVVDVERNAEGVPTALSLSRVVDVGGASDFVSDVAPARLAFSADGSTVWLALPGTGTLATLE